MPNGYGPLGGRRPPVPPGDEGETIRRLLEMMGRWLEQGQAPGQTQAPGDLTYRGTAYPSQWRVGATQQGMPTPYGPTMGAPTPPMPPPRRGPANQADYMPGGQFYRGPANQADYMPGGQFYRGPAPPTGGTKRPPGKASPPVPVAEDAANLLRQIVDGINVWRESWGQVQKFATERRPTPVDTDAMRQQANQIFQLILKLVQTPFTQWGREE